MNRNKTPLAIQREKLEMTQLQMAIRLKTTQSEISKTEAGEMPPSELIERWAKAYKLRVKRFKIAVESVQWSLPLWQYAVRTPQDVEVIECKAQPHTNCA